MSINFLENVNIVAISCHIMPYHHIHMPHMYHSTGSWFWHYSRWSGYSMGLALIFWELFVTFTGAKRRVRADWQGKGLSWTVSKCEPLQNSRRKSFCVVYNILYTIIYIYIHINTIYIYKQYDMMLCMCILYYIKLHTCNLVPIRRIANMNVVIIM